MEITNDLVIRLEDLCRLTLTEAEREETKEEIGRLLVHMEVLNQVDEKELEALPPFPTAAAVLRDDHPEHFTGQDGMLQAAPETERGFYKVPKTVD